MEEKRFGTVLGAVRYTPIGLAEYGLVITDRRSIFVLELLSKSHLGSSIGSLGGAFGSYGRGLGKIIGWLIPKIVERRKKYDYARLEPEFLARLKDSVVVPHHAIERVQFKGESGQNSLHISYRQSGGGTEKMNVTLGSSKQYLREQARQGKDRKQAMRDVMDYAQGLYREALPLVASMKVRWSGDESDGTYRQASVKVSPTKPRVRETLK